MGVFSQMGTMNRIISNESAPNTTSTVSNQMFKKISHESSNPFNLVKNNSYKSNNSQSNALLRKASGKSANSNVNLDFDFLPPITE